MAKFFEALTAGYELALSRLFRGDAIPVPTQHQIDPRTRADDEFGNYVSRVEALQKYLKIEDDRKRRYEQYRSMDDTDLAAGIADMYAEDVTTPNPDTGRTVWIISNNQNIVDAGNRLFKRIEMEEIVFSICRDMLLMGDDFERTIYCTGEGIQALRFVDPDKVSRKEDRFNRLMGFHQDGQQYKRYVGSDGKDPSLGNLANPWDYIHFAIMSKNRNHPKYGTSIFHNAVRAWKQIILSEDESLMHQLQRSPDRLKWKVDVGTSDETEALKTLNRFRHRVKKFNIIDPLQASYQQQYNPISPMEDIFLPVRPNSMTDVELMTGATSGDKMDSTKYYMQKFHNNLRVPMSYRGYEDQVSNDVNRRGRLSNQSMLYARALRRVQRSLRIGLRTMMEIHLTLLNPDVENSPYDWRKDGQDFEIVMEPVSYLEEIDRLEGMNSRVTLAGAMLALVPPLTLGAQAALNNDEWQRYVFKEILRLPEHVMDALYKEAKSQPPASGLPTPQPENRNGASLVFKTIEKLRDRKQLSEAEFHAFSALVETNPSNAARLRAFSRDISEARASRVDIDLPKAGQKMKDNVNDADQTVERSR